MTFRKLNWEQLDGTFGKDFFAEIKGFDSRYYIYIDRNTGKTIGIDLFRNKQDFNTIQDAKDFYEKDFENKMIDLLAS